jgi:hypothetical protein
VSPRPHRRLLQDHGQASLEWLGVVLLVAAMLALGAGLAQADAVGRRVTRQMARAICLVSGGDCRRDQEPCVEASDSDRDARSGGVLIFRLGYDRFGLVERRSDGTYAVSLGQEWSGGLEGEAGVGIDAHVAGLDVSAGGALTASILARLKDARTWIVGSEAEAEAILAARDASRPPNLSSSDRAWVPSGGVSADLGIEGVADLNALSAALTADQHAGTVTDHRTGRRTTYIDAQLSASASALDGVLATSTRDAREIYAVERTADGRPVALQITATGAYGGSRDLPPVVQPVVGRLETPGADRYEVTATLDLSDPAALQAATEMLDDIAHKRGRAKPSAALRELVASSGTVEARILATATSSDETSGGVMAGTRLVKFGHVTEHSEQRLLAAASRGLDGQWIAREDCVRPA